MVVVAPERLVVIGKLEVTQKYTDYIEKLILL